MESEPVAEAPAVEPARLTDAGSKKGVEAEPIAAWPLPLDLDRVPAG